MGKTRMTSEKRPASLYSIGEWYGHDIVSLEAAARSKYAKMAASKVVKRLPCPFREDRMCHKAGGVCSIRRYVREKAGSGIHLGPLVTTCPNRFFDQGEVFRWVGEVLLGTDKPIVLGEIPFLQKLHSQASSDHGETDGDDADFIGRIDNILVHPHTEQRLSWCALEMQAVYFSGKAMGHEFADIHDHPGELRFPVKARHPDYRSSGPKRLLPQLQTKVPELARWGRKMAVCVDEAFFGELVGIEEVRHLSNADLAWFVVRYEQDGAGFRLRRGRHVFSKLDSTVKALTGGVPMPMETFESQIKGRLRSSH